jgi:ATP-dependent DNA helicase RecG
MTTINDLNNWLRKPENINLEFKEARRSFSQNKDLPDYCAALANEGGGKLVLGVDDPTHRVVGTQTFHGTYQKLSHELLQKLKIRVDVEELHHPDGRVLIFHVPPHPPGQAIKSTGKYTYPMRAGESLVEMDNMTLKRILNENEPDFSAGIVDGLGLSDLDETALVNFNNLWAEKAAREDYRSFPFDKMLRSIGLLSDKGLNYACLILFGKKEKIDTLLPCSEIIFEWRHERKIAHDFRIAWREPFFKIHDEVWDTINARNLRMPFQDGLFQREIYAFSEKPVREALLNAVAHRDYTINSQSIFIKASPEVFVIESPGGFPTGITIENILYSTAWRNRCIAETFEKAGLVERSGQGMDDIFGNTIQEGKGLPDLSRSDAFSVRLNIPAQVQDTKFILFLERVVKEKQILFSFEEIYALEQVREKQLVNNTEYKEKFLKLGIIEQVGKTRGAKYILSHKYYVHEGKAGVHTRIVNLERDKQKELILKHLKKNQKGFMKDFQDIFPELKPRYISNLLQELKHEGKTVHLGARKSGYWLLA